MSIFRKQRQSTKNKNVDKRNKSLKTISITSTILFLAAVLVFNIVFDKFLGQRLKWDWSTGSQYTIGEVTEGLIGKMTADVQIIGLFEKESDQNYTKIQPMLDEYVQNSNNRITLRYVDPVKNPGIVKEVDPEGYMNLAADTFVVYCPATKKAKALTYEAIYSIGYDQSTYQSYIQGVIAEESITGAIKYVTAETTPVIYFVSGHSELDYETNYSIMVSIFRNNNFEVKSIDLFGLAEIPADCATLFMAAPQKDISADERELLTGYLKKGGSLLVAVSYNNTKYPELNTLLSEFNLEISNNKIREGDKDYRYQDNAYSIRASAPVNSITTSAISGLTLVDNARAINVLKVEKEQITVETLLTTSKQGVAETNGDASLSSAPGTQNIAMISKNDAWPGTGYQPSAKVMVLGSSSIFSDAALNISSRLYNVYLGFYGIQWLTNASASESLYIEPKAAVSYYVTKGTNSTYVAVAVLVLLLIPVALLLTALFVYRKRRHL